MSLLSLKVVFCVEAFAVEHGHVKTVLVVILIRICLLVALSSSLVIFFFHSGDCFIDFSFFFSGHLSFDVVITFWNLFRIFGFGVAFEFLSLVVSFVFEFLLLFEMLVYLSLNSISFILQIFSQIHFNLLIPLRYRSSNFSLCVLVDNLYALKTQLFSFLVNRIIIIIYSCSFNHLNLILFFFTFVSILSRCGGVGAFEHFVALGLLLLVLLSFYAFANLFEFALPLGDSEFTRWLLVLFKFFFLGFLLLFSSSFLSLNRSSDLPSFFLVTLRAKLDIRLCFRHLTMKFLLQNRIVTTPIIHSFLFRFQTFESFKIRFFPLRNNRNRIISWIVVLTVNFSFQFHENGFGLVDSR